MEQPKFKASPDKRQRRKSRMPLPQKYQIDASLFNKFEKFNSDMRKKQFKKNLENCFGKNHIVKYHNQYNFLQQWEDNKLHTKQKCFNILQQTQPYYLIFSFILMITNIFTIWTISVERYFNTQQISQKTNIYIIELILLISKVVANLILSYKNQPDQSSGIKAILINNKKTILCVIYFIVGFFFHIETFLINIFQFVVIGILYQTSASIYKNMKIMEFGLKYQNPIKILNLFSNILIEAHIFALILYNASKIDEDQNWIKAINIQQLGPLSKYIYSFYFASTTMLTIGYGDITPTNIYQIMINVLIQIVGVISFGYLVNEMGHTLGKMRESSEELERDLQTINKISKYYNLQKDLQNKAKSFVINNQTKAEELKVEDQDNLLMKLNEDLRGKINHQNSLSVVKSSIFFLCNWSKNMQSLIALKLQKKLFSPNEKLHFPDGVDRIYVIKKGKIEILMNKYGNGQEHKKVLKVIDCQKNKQVSDNVYGYTSIFSNKKVFLEGIAKDFTATYSVDKYEFLECVKKNPKDFEYYHEIKCKIDEALHCEQYETPSIVNIRQHYCPSRYFVIIKNKKFMSISKNERKYRKRNIRFRFMLINAFKIQNIDSMDDLMPQRMTTEKTLQFTTQKYGTLKGLDIIPQGSLQDHDSQNIESSLQKCYRMVESGSKIKNKNTQEFEMEVNRYNISHKLDQCHEFSNYFKFHNITRVLQHLQNQNYLEQRVK